MPVIVEEMEIVPQEPRQPERPRGGSGQSGGEAPSLPKEDGWRKMQVALDRAARVHAH